MLLTSLSKMAIFLMKSKRCFQGYRGIFILFKNLCPEFFLVPCNGYKIIYFNLIIISASFGLHCL